MLVLEQMGKRDASGALIKEPEAIQIVQAAADSCKSKTIASLAREEKKRLSTKEMRAWFNEKLEAMLQAHEVNLRRKFYGMP